MSARTCVVVVLPRWTNWTGTIDLVRFRTLKLVFGVVGIDSSLRIICWFDPVKCTAWPPPCLARRSTVDCWPPKSRGERRPARIETRTAKDRCWTWCNISQSVGWRPRRSAAVNRCVVRRYWLRFVHTLKQFQYNDERGLCKWVLYGQLVGRFDWIVVSEKHFPSHCTETALESWKMAVQGALVRPHIWMLELTIN